jgi:hypothetical protein
VSATTPEPSEIAQQIRPGDLDATLVEPPLEIDLQVGVDIDRYNCVTPRSDEGCL